MNPDHPYVVVVCGLSAGVGKTTLASNLAIYLKALVEDLPVAYLPLDENANPDATFALAGRARRSLAEFNEVDNLVELLSFGQFGVEYCKALPAGSLAPQPQQLRRWLSRSDYPGVVLCDVSSQSPFQQAALMAADLLLAIVKDPASLGELTALRQEFRTTGGDDRQICLLPSQLGDLQHEQPQLDLEGFLRFAAEERGFQVLKELLPAEPRVAEKISAGQAVLTRVPESRSHQQLHQLAEFLLARKQAGEYLPSRVSRAIDDQLLPTRAARVDFCCPVCEQSVWAQKTHYLESAPARRRLLLHQDCLDQLLNDLKLAEFKNSWELLLMQPAAAHGGENQHIRLQLFDASGERLEGRDFPLPVPSGWSKVLHAATGRHPVELYGETLLLANAQPVDTVLTTDWYQNFKRLCRQLRQRCVTELW